MFVGALFFWRRAFPSIFLSQVLNSILLTHVLIELWRTLLGRILSHTFPQSSFTKRRRGWSKLSFLTWRWVQLIFKRREGPGLIFYRCSELWRDRTHFFNQTEWITLLFFLLRTSPLFGIFQGFFQMKRSLRWRNIGNTFQTAMIHALTVRDLLLFVHYL